MADGTRPSRVQPGLDPPSKADHVRIRRARKIARTRLVHSDQADPKRRRAAFREELGSVVRSASPLLVSVLGLHGITLDDAVYGIGPARDWPISPMLSDWNSGALHPSLPLRRPGRVPRHHLTVPPFHGVTIVETARERARLQVIDHSLELEGMTGSIRFRTRFGQLRLDLADDLPEALLMACVGRRVGEVVDYVGWRGLDWIIAATRTARYPWIGQALFSAIGTSGYRLPWTR